MDQSIFKLQPSWRTDTSHMILQDIFAPEVSVIVWQRYATFASANQQVSEYFAAVFGELGLGIREVFPMHSLIEDLADRLPNGQGQHDAGKRAAIEDMHLLSDMLTCLFNCDSVGLRLAPLSSAMCPAFHTDRIPVRLVCTYLGAGTEWLPQETISSDMAKLAVGARLDNTKLLDSESHVRQMSTFDVGLLKGSAWQNHEAFDKRASDQRAGDKRVGDQGASDQRAVAAIHRSCAVAQHQQRVLLTLDPM